MKKLLSMILVIAMLMATAAAYAEGNRTQEDTAQNKTRQEQRAGRGEHGSRKNRKTAEDGEPADTHDQSSETEETKETDKASSEDASGDTAEKRSKARRSKISELLDLEELTAKGVISQETCDKIKSYFAERKHTSGESIHSRNADGEKADSTAGQKEKASAEALLAKLLEKEILTQEEYDAIAAAISENAQ